MVPLSNTWRLTRPSKDILFSAFQSHLRAKHRGREKTNLPSEGGVCWLWRCFSSICFRRKCSCVVSSQYSWILIYFCRGKARQDHPAAAQATVVLSPESTPQTTPRTGTSSAAFESNGPPSSPESNEHKRKRSTASAPFPRPQRTWLRKIQARTDEVRRIFGLDPDEQLINDYLCALKKKVLLQGRLFVFERHLCFHASLFGYHKTKIIPFERVENVKKRKNVGFPNSIEVTWKQYPPQSPPVPEAIHQSNVSDASGPNTSDSAPLDSKREFFTSFLSREDAYRLVLGLWAEHSPLAQERAEEYMHSARASDEEVETYLESKEGEEKYKDAFSIQHLSLLKIPRISISSLHGSRSRHNGNHDVGSDGEGAGGEEAQPYTAEGHEWGLQGISSADRDLKPSSHNDAMTSSTDEIVELDGHIDRNNAKVRLKDDWSSFDDQAYRSVPEFEECNLSNDPDAVEREFDTAAQPAPSLPASMQRVLTCVLPTTSRGFFSTFLSSSSDFFVAFHETQGHRNVKLSAWQRHYQVGPVRDLRFVTPLKGWKLGPPEALCHQTQRYRVYKDEHLVFETSQAMSDIPYSDYFRVETRWDVTPGIDPGTCSIVVHIAVPFTKSTMWRKFIEKSVTESSLEAYQMFTQLAGKELAESRPKRTSVRSVKGEGMTEDGVDGSNANAALESMHDDSIYAARPPSPEEILPSTDADWELLLAQVEPQWRGGLRSLRRRYQSRSDYDGASKAAGWGIGPHHKRHSSFGGRTLTTLEQFDPSEAKPSPFQSRSTKEDPKVWDGRDSASLVGSLGSLFSWRRSDTALGSDEPTRMPSFSDLVDVPVEGIIGRLCKFLGSVPTRLGRGIFVTISTWNCLLFWTIVVHIILLGIQLGYVGKVSQLYRFLEWSSEDVVDSGSLLREARALSKQTYSLQNRMDQWKEQLDVLIAAVNELNGKVNQLQYD